MADSWEEHAEHSGQPSKSKPLSLNPNAATFSFNPGASSFVPVFGAPSQPPPPPAAVPQPSSFASQPPPPPRPAAPAAPAAAPEAAPASAATAHEANGAAPMQEDPPSAAPAAPKQADAAASAMEGLRVEEDLVEDDLVEEDSDREAARQKILEALAKEDLREHLNVVFIGHVDAGKSTTGGQILYLTGGVDERTIEKYEREAKDKNRESWYMAYIMDTNEEERAKGKTVEVGRAQFETNNRRYTILDAPGHKNYVPNMIGGAAQADVGVLVVSARKGEFETGFERGGQTREHAQLAKTLGVSKLVVVVNKMDDHSIVGPNKEWSQERYDEVVTKLTPFLRSCGYNPKKDLEFLPISGLHGSNIKEPLGKDVAPWWTGSTLFSVLDGVEPPARDPMMPFRMPIIDRYRDMGTIVMGKSEAGVVLKGDNLMVMPNKVKVKVVSVFRDEAEVSAARAGENLRLRLSGIEEEDISSGFVVCSRWDPVPAVTMFDAQLQILELLEHKAIFTAGYKAVMHIHSVVEECEVMKLIAQIDTKTKEKKKVKFVKSNSILTCRIGMEKPICVESFDKVPQLGRFTLRDEGRTIAIGKIIKLPKSRD